MELGSDFSEETSVWVLRMRTFPMGNEELGPWEGYKYLCNSEQKFN